MIDHDAEIARKYSGDGDGRIVQLGIIKSILYVCKVWKENPQQTDTKLEKDRRYTGPYITQSNVTNVRRPETNR